MNRLSCIVAGVLLSLTSVGAQAQQPYREGIDDSPSAAAMAVDFVLIRPLGLVTTVAGAGLFVVTLPFTALQGDAGTAARRFVGEPAQFTFTRPLGEIP